jgi:hypothetical protein
LPRRMISRAMWPPWSKREERPNTIWMFILRPA